VELYKVHSLSDIIRMVGHLVGQSVSQSASALFAASCVNHYK
jgi:hypothetical protein